ncbi:AraC family transcriptional regulator [Saccharibacillus sp. JS10]|uniref:AraC family transcriptional regulator n=1 Tax=Saccharibacillus sp. JS10 TaxID=2950552 RepID=UPI00210E0B33|nr:helix-turn-helix domain-containing protein [Saccharibacillus sp. JS10]MCQ4086481.1 helix-turn-helix domain-containing protein [Saccharibacillus sp. JS10]
MNRQKVWLTLKRQAYFCLPESVGHYSHQPEHHVKREEGASNNFNIHYVASGKGYVEIDGTVHELRSGQAVLYFPLQKQHYYSSEDDPWDIRWIHFYGDRLHDYMIERGFHRHSLWTLRQSSNWEQAHLELLDEAQRDQMLHQSRLSTLTYGVLAEFVHQAVPLKKTRMGKAENRILNLLPQMQSQACEPFLLSDWSKQAGVSDYYFCKLFKTLMEMTPMEFITRSRLQMAKQWLLEHPDRNIGQIAEDAGYPSVSYFNRQFRASENKTPTEYRKLY